MDTSIAHTIKRGKIRRTRKGQLTIIIIIGILIFTMIVFLLYLQIFKTQTSLNKEQTEAATNTGLLAVKEHVNGCIEQTASQALELVGKQAGNIYLSQGGFKQDTLIEGEDYIEQSYRTGYGLKRPSADIGTLFYFTPPQYPWPTFPYTTDSFDTIDLTGYYGTFELPELLASNESMLAQIEYYINAKLASCFDFMVFKQYNIAYGNVTSSVIIGENNVKGNLVVNVNLPLTINKITNDEQTRLEDFSIIMGVRLKLIYDVAKTVIEQESTSLLFDPGTVSYEGIDISLARNIFNKDDILILTDTRSNLFGKPYEFQFGVQNRYPMIHYIIEENLPTLHTADILSFTENESFTVTRNGELIYSQPLSQFVNARAVYDPDGDTVVYTTNPTMPYAVQDQDVAQGSFPLSIRALDGSVDDYQDITFRTEYTE